MRNSKLRTRRSKQLQRRRRNGSVMIMVVALLVLLALMGTAWIATVRNDRSASAANVANAENELLLEGLKNITAAVVGIDAVHGKKTAGGGQTVYRPRADMDDQTPPKPVYEYSDAVSALPVLDGTYLESEDHFNEFLASRVPLSGGAGPYWPAISGPLVHNGISTPGTEGWTRGMFETPVWAANTGTEPPYYRQRLGMKPTVVQLTGSDGITRTYPAFLAKDTKNNDRTFLAADTDGDGVADAGLWRLPVGEQNGITWYAAARIIDNNSAVNAAVAWQTAGNAYDFYPTNISLGNILGAGATQINDLNQKYRFGGSGGSTAAVDSRMTRDDMNDAAGDGFSWTTEQEALWMQLGRRLENPWFLGTGGLRARELDITDQMALARGFINRADAYSATKLEQLLSSSLWFNKLTYTNNDAGITAWYVNFDYGTPASPKDTFNPRPLLVTRNAVSNHAVVARDAAGAILHPQTGTTVAEPAMKASLNAASFSDLWLAYWNVMVDQPNAASGDTTPFGKLNEGNAIPKDAYLGMAFGGETHPWRMFRSSIRNTDATYRLLPKDQLKLRSALAAFNTIQLRSNFARDSQNIQVEVASGNNGKAVLYGFKDPQPFITEIYVHANKTKVVNAASLALTDRNPDGYIAVELYNPNHGQDINLSGWKLVAIKRDHTYPLVLTDVHTFGAQTLKKNDFIVLENVEVGKDNGDGTAQYRPKAAESGSMPTGDPRYVLVATLKDAMDKELVLLRPAGGGMAPVDQFDFTGLTIPAEGAATAFSWHYSRGCKDAVAGKPEWKCVYPGRYDGRLTSKRQEGTTDAGSQFDPNMPAPTDPPDPAAAPAKDPWIASPPTAGITLGKLSDASYSRTFEIRLDGLARSAQYPFGGFPRVGDVMQVPFIGSYAIYDKDNNLVEMNAVTMDSAFAEDTDTDAANDAMEQVGRLCPLYPKDWNSAPADWRYRWATKVLDYFTVWAPHEDFLPNAPAEEARKHEVGNASFTSKNTPNERLLGVEGLININTAPWKVVASLPLVPGNQTATDDLAKKIVDYRDANGPFKNLFDLYNVPDVRTVVLSEMATDGTAAQGVLSPGNGIREFEEYHAWLNRLSNLVTTRSDTFTAYLLIQGWRNVGPGLTPELVVQRRTGVIIDRNRMYKPNGTPPADRIPDVKTFPFPVE